MDGYLQNVLDEEALQVAETPTDWQAELDAQIARDTAPAQPARRRSDAAQIARDLDEMIAMGTPSEPEQPAWGSSSEAEVGYVSGYTEGSIGTEATGWISEGELEALKFEDVPDVPVDKIKPNLGQEMTAEDITPWLDTEKYEKITLQDMGFENWEVQLNQIQMPVGSPFIRRYILKVSSSLRAFDAWRKEAFGKKWWTSSKFPEALEGIQQQFKHISTTLVQCNRAYTILYERMKDTKGGLKLYKYSEEDRDIAQTTLNDLHNFPAKIRKFGKLVNHYGHDVWEHAHTVRAKHVKAMAAQETEKKVFETWQKHSPFETLFLQHPPAPGAYGKTRSANRFLKQWIKGPLVRWLISTEKTPDDINDPKIWRPEMLRATPGRRMLERWGLQEDIMPLVREAYDKKIEYERKKVLSKARGKKRDSLDPDTIRTITDKIMREETDAGIMNRIQSEMIALQHTHTRVALAEAKEVLEQAKTKRRKIIQQNRFIRSYDEQKSFAEAHDDLNMMGHIKEHTRAKRDKLYKLLIQENQGYLAIQRSIKRL